MLIAQELITATTAKTCSNISTQFLICIAAMKIIKLLSQLSIKFRGIHGHFILIATLLIKYLKITAWLHSYFQTILNIVPCESVEENFLFILEEDKQH